MSKQVIDELIVTLGLDSSKFTAGQKQAAQTLLETKRAVTSSVGEMGSALTGFAGKLSAFYLGFEGLKGVINLVKETAYQFKQLGITAEMLGTSVRNTRVASEFSQLAGAGGNALSDFVMGGRMQLSSLTLGGIPKWALPALVGLNPFTAFNGSPEEVFKRFQDAAGSHAGALQRMMPGASTPQMATQQFLQMAGFDPALAAEATNRKHAEADLTRAMRDNANVTNRMAENGRAAVAGFISLKTQAENAATIAFPALIRTTMAVEVGFAHLLRFLNDILSSPIAQFIEKTASMSIGSPTLKKWWEFESKTRQDEEAAASGIFSGIGSALHWIHGLGARDSMYRPFASPLGALSLLPTPDALMHSMPQINFAPGQTASLIGPGGQGGTNNSFAIGSISVNTAATDAGGIAADLNAAIHRKFSVTQADSGMVS